jgi:hypothetical protein
MEEKSFKFSHNATRRRNYMNEYSNIDDHRTKTIVSSVKEFKDIPTKHFINNILSNDTSLYYFIGYLFHKLQSAIAFDVYHMLTDKEQVIVLFKGGALMYEMFKNIKLFIGEYSKNIAQYFTMSDIDFSLFIMTDSQQRFDEIHKVCIKVLNNVLKEISHTFDEYYHEVIQNKIYNYENTSHEFDDYDPLKLYAYIKKTYKIDLESKQKLEKYIDWLMRMIKQNNFYTKTKLDKILTDTIKTIKNGNDMYYTDDNKQIIFLHKDLMNNAQATITKKNHIYIAPKILYVDDKKKKAVTVEKYNESGEHRISYNTSISTNKLFPQIFELMRIKMCYNVEGDWLQNIIYDSKEKNDQNVIYLQKNKSIMTSEFLDISIPMFDDHKRKNFQKHAVEYLNNNEQYYNIIFSCENKHIIKVYCYSPENLLADLNELLFMSDTVVPWEDGKYEKRIYRQLFFSFYVDIKKYNNNQNINKTYFVYKHPLGSIVSVLKILKKCVFMYQVILHNFNIVENEYKKLKNLCTSLVKSAYNDEAIANNIISQLDSYRSINIFFDLISKNKPVKEYEIYHELLNWTILWCIIILNNENIYTIIHEIKKIYKYDSDENEILVQLYLYLSNFIKIYSEMVIKIIQPDNMKILYGGYYANKYDKYKKKYLSLKNNKK